MVQKFKIPVQYQYLLDEKTIDQKTVENNRDLRRIFSRVPKNVPDRIRRNLAVISLHYANEYIQSKVPLFKNGVIRLLRFHMKRKTRGVTVYRFKAEVLTPAHRKEEDYKQIQAQEFVALKEDDVEILSGKVYKSTENFIKMKGTLVMPNVNPPPMPREGVIVTIYKAVIDFVPAAISKAIENIEGGGLDEFIHPKPRMSSLKKFFKTLGPQIDQFVSDYPQHARLNKEQKTAVYVISKGLHKPHPFVLFGPPGTGKTATIVAAVVQLMKQDETNRLLICTPSNTAADRVTKELLNHLDGKLLRNDNVLRLCSLSLDYDHRDRSLDVISNVGLGEYEMPTSFTNYRIIITTLATSVRLLYEFFTHIIVDEAGQALEAEIWIPLGCCASEDTSVILCGDPKQLGPVNILNFPEKFSNYLECPLNWYLKMTDYAIDYRLCVRLIDCFRCHGHIVKIASDLFYNRRLRDAGDKEWKSKLCSDPSWFNGQFPIAFIDPKKSFQHMEPHGTSVGNHKEVMIVCKVLKYLNEKLSIDFDKIGVVSPYKYHSRLIREKVIQKFNSKIMDALTVDSVERFQGSEREVIIITTARTEGLGFLSCDLRLNTAITRAQRLLIVIGKKTNLQKHGSWKKFISYVDENNSIYTELPVVKSLSDKMLKLKVTDSKN